MGKDKFENEHLIKWKWDSDIWFHVDEFSSAHVYLRLSEPIDKLEDIPKDILMECAILAKANSKTGVKRKAAQIVYTFAGNLKKEPGFKVGAVAFHDNTMLKHITVEKNNPIVRKLEKTKIEAFPNLENEYHEYLKQRALREELLLKQKEEERKEEEVKKKEEEEAKSYDWMMKEKQYLTSNKDEVEEDDDFMQMNIRK